MWCCTSVTCCCSVHYTYYTYWFLLLSVHTPHANTHTLPHDPPTIPHTTPPHPPTPPLTTLSDLKSPNLLVDRAWHVKVADFGLSKLLDASKSRSSLVVMNPKWLSPEIIRNESHSRASDVYSFGVVLWELMTLREPFEEIANPIQIAFAVANNGARPFVPEDVENVPGGGFDGMFLMMMMMVGGCDDDGV